MSNIKSPDWIKDSISLVSIYHNILSILEGIREKFPNNTYKLTFKF